MRKSILFLMFLLASVSFANAQYIVVPDVNEKPTVQTTVEEYDYLTKDYKSYLPLRQGYKLENAKTVSYTLDGVDRVFNFKKFVRTETDEVAAILVEYVRVSKGRTYTIYFCIPRESSSDAVWRRVQATLEAFQTTEVRNAYMWALTKYISGTF